MEPIVIFMLAAFTLAFGCLWGHRRAQFVSLRKQRTFYRLFSDEVQAFRAGDYPDVARALVEQLVQMPLDPKMVRHVSIRMLLGRMHPAPAVPGDFLRTLRTLPPKPQAAFIRVVVTFFLAFTAGDWLFGSIIRRMRLSGLDEETQAEVAIETVASYGI